ncbi:MAG: hypothetical protein OEX00_04710 [Gammaproteobacteria bacterium]|nr:hypothetical protein [Gammaproteobacteria bacterium]MDH5692768.1 hypothetical protein [Gammaproteobacteria bacterium]
MISRQHIHSIFLAVAVILVAVVVTSCSEDEQTNPNPVVNDPEPLLNGCKSSTSVDLRGTTAVTINATSAWDLSGHQACIIVDVGTTVTWEGNFNNHPLVGGETPTTDAASPITLGSPMSGTNPVPITFTSTGDFPYYCSSHPSTMKGVVYVR